MTLIHTLGYIGGGLGAVAFLLLVIAFVEIVGDINSNGRGSSTGHRIFFYIIFPILGICFFLTFGGPR